MLLKVSEIFKLIENKNTILNYCETMDKKVKDLERDLNYYKEADVWHKLNKKNLTEKYSKIIFEQNLNLINSVTKRKRKN